MTAHPMRQFPQLAPVWAGGVAVVVLMLAHVTIWPAHRVVLLVVFLTVLLAFVATPRATRLIVAGVVLLLAADLVVDGTRNTIRPGITLAAMIGCLLAWQNAERRVGVAWALCPHPGQRLRPANPPRLVPNPGGAERVIAGGAGSIEFPGEPIRRYFACWNQLSAPQRLLWLDEWWAEDAVFVDRYISVPIEGVTGLSAYIDRVQRDYPGHRFEVLSVDAHHASFHATRVLLAPSGRAVARGVDVGEVDPTGRLRRVVRFQLAGTGDEPSPGDPATR